LGLAAKKDGKVVEGGGGGKRGILFLHQMNGSISTRRVAVLVITTSSPHLTKTSLQEGKEKKALYYQPLHPQSSSLYPRIHTI
jgi:hypothetical protein